MKKNKEEKNPKQKNSSIISQDNTGVINPEEPTDNRLIHNNKNSLFLDFKDSYNTISLEETFLLRYSDPINTISLSDNFLLFGSMIGKVILYNISKKHFYQLYDLANENIMGSSLENNINDKIVHYIAIGDESVVSFFEKETEKDIEANTMNNYENRETHNQYCEKNFTMLWKNKVLIINLYSAEKYDEEFDFRKNSYTLITYEIEDKKKDSTEVGFIEMSNYSVPFDFRDNIFLFLEHIQDNKRNICIFEFKGEKKENEKNDEKKILIQVDKDFGHISFLKIINRNMVLMVRNYNDIEIYDIEKEFKLISSYKNSYEINDIDFYEIKDENEKNDDNIISTNLKYKYYNIIFFDVEQNIVELNLAKESNIELDKCINFQINIKNIDEIGQNLKDKGLFNLDFAYYIRNSPHYVAITSDQACFLFRKEKH